MPTGTVATTFALFVSITEMSSLCTFSAYRRSRAASNSSAKGCVPTRTRVVTRSVAASMKATLSSSRSATNTVLPSGATATPAGARPSGTEGSSASVAVSTTSRRLAYQSAA